jgi:hypothetical protein
MFTPLGENIFHEACRPFGHWCVLHLPDPLAWRKISQAQSFENIFLGGNGNGIATPQLIVSPHSPVHETHKINI